MSRVDATPAAAAALAQVPGLRQRVEDVLRAIIDTAVEIRRMQDGFSYFDARPGEFMRVRVASYLISYTLDVEAQAAKVLFVERAAGRSDEAPVA